MHKQLFSIHLFMLNRIGPPLIYPLKSPVFIGVSEDEWLKFTLHHPSSSFNYARYKRGAAYQIG